MMGDNMEVRRLAAVMFTDMAGYTALTQRNEALALSLLEKQNGILLPLIRAFGGTPIKTIGDAHLAEFESALTAVRCAVEIQRKLRDYANSAAPDQGFKLRIGIHVGDVVHKNNDVFGDAVNIASRLEPIAEPGGICISQQVYDQVQNKVEYILEKLPAQSLKNVSMRIDVYKVLDGQQPVQRKVFDPDMPKERVAVLPLSNFSPSQQDEYLADGMTEELITAISGVQGIKVIARTSVMKFKNAVADIAEIGRTLRAGTILEGSFRKIGERIRVTVQLIDAKTEEHIWASNYDGDMKDIFSIQTDIANKVAQALKGKLLEQVVPTQKPVNIEAYELYLKGRNFWNRRNKEGVIQALKLFQGAIEKDPNFAKAYSGIADSYMIGEQNHLFVGEASDKARAAIQRAIALDDTIAEAHASKGLLLSNDFQFAEAEMEFRRALSLNPSYASAHHWYSICLANLGRLDEAIQEATLASQSDPLAAPSRNILGVMYIYARQFEKAQEIFDEILKLDPEFSPTLSFKALIYTYRGMEREATDLVELSLRGASEFERFGTLAYQKAWFGHKEDALKCLEEAEKTAPSPKELFSLRASFFGISGDADEFFKWIGRALDSKDFSPEDLRFAFWLDRVRPDPRYQQLLKSLPA